MKKHRWHKLVNVALVLALLLVLIAMPVVTLWSQPAYANPGWYNTSWSYRKKITIDHTKVPNTNQTNFPVLINRTDTDWKDTANGGHVGQSDGGDILFTSSDGTTKLDHEIEKYVPSTGELIAWVEVPAVSASVDTEIYIYYGYAAASDQWNVTGTWDSNFKMVQHLEETSGTHEDSTLNNNDGTAYNEVNQNATGKIDGADDFDGSNDYVDLGNPASLDFTGAITVELWMKASGFHSSWNYLVRHKSKFEFGFYDSDVKPRFKVKNSSGTRYEVWGNALNTGEWYHVVGIRNGSFVGIYVDGVLVNSRNDFTADLADQTYVTIGGETTNDSFNGTIDEVRISNTARSADWIKTCYNNQSDPGAFYSVGSEETPIQAPTVTNSTGASNVTHNSARLNGEVTSTGGENPTAHIYWGATDGVTTPS